MKLPFLFVLPSQRPSPRLAANLIAVFIIVMTVIIGVSTSHSSGRNVRSTTIGTGNTNEKNSDGSGSDKAPFRLERCQGDCDSDDDCIGSLVCHERIAGEPVPGCLANDVDINSHTDFCIREEDLHFDPDPDVVFVRDRKPGMPRLELCEGDCDNDDDCLGELVCYQRDENQAVRGCQKGEHDESATDFCVLPLHLHNEDHEEKEVPTNTQPRTTPKEPALIPTVISSTTTYDPRGNMELMKPSGVELGDLLLAFLSRTDDVLPVEIPSSGWKPVASCLKEYNEQPNCATIDDCIEGEKYEVGGYVYCCRFRIQQSGMDGQVHDSDVDGRDLATVVFAKIADQEDLDQNTYLFDLDGGGPAWSTMSVVRNGALELRGFAGSSCDDKHQTIFPSIFAEPYDLLLLHMAFDDTADVNDFTPPIGSQLAAYEHGPDEAGFLFQETVTDSGETGVRVTGGKGGSVCKDAILTMVVKGKNGP